MIALSSETLSTLPASVEVFPYDRTALKAGIVHLSVGNFHRAHQCWYVDRLLSQPGNEGWAFCGVGLIDDATERLKLEAFPAQDNLYTLTRYAPDGTTRHQVIGSMLDYLFAPADPQAVLARMADPETRIVSMTITEGGYNQDHVTGSYRLETPLTQRELAAPNKPESAFGYIVEALRIRREAGIAPFTVMSCDNLRDNGIVTQRSVVSHARALDPELAEWIEQNVTFPSSMVDRITPAVLKEDADRVNIECGVHDRLPVISEEFAQWVIEDRFVNGRPALEKVGAQIVPDVHPYELAKVRMLNASHSMLAYPGQLSGLETVRDAIIDPQIGKLVERFMSLDVIPHLSAPQDMPLPAYRDLIIARFSNPNVGDRLARITGDGGSKLPVFLAPSWNKLVASGASLDRVAFVLACFIRYLRGRTDQGETFTPFEPALSDTQRKLAQSWETVFTMTVFESFTFDDGHRRVIREMAESMEQRGTSVVLAELLAAEPASA
ncbi:mannitol dehydrogenase family protein [Asaia sp. HN010]|uniref:mannitol dehydrogenase family protein n=1 Tax=Asaia sp. HN010 TaxID=3081233 RepID=UPI003015ED45